MNETINFKKFYEEYGILWSNEGRKNYEIMASKWKSDRILSLISNNKLRVNNILDFGCGPAYLLSMICNSLKIEKSYGGDISYSMLKLAKKNFPKAKYYNMTDLSKFKVKVDLIVLIDVLEHVLVPEKILKQALKISKYQLIKVPLESALIINVLKKIGFFRKNSEGHINFWRKSSFIHFLKDQKLEIIDYWEGNPPKELHFYPRELKTEIKKDTSKNKLFLVYDFFSKITFPFKRVYSYLFGSNLFVLTKYKINKNETSI